MIIYLFDQFKNLHYASLYWGLFPRWLRIQADHLPPLMQKLRMNGAALPLPDVTKACTGINLTLTDR
jgi:hypothetical protein